jgi:hypothetical protein
VYLLVFRFHTDVFCFQFAILLVLLSLDLILENEKQHYSTTSRQKCSKYCLPVHFGHHLPQSSQMIPRTLTFVAAALLLPAIKRPIIRWNFIYNGNNHRANTCKLTIIESLSFSDKGFSSNKESFI